MKGIFKEISAAGITGYNFIDPMRKLKALNQLIELMHELQIFRKNLSGLFEKQNDMSKDKSKLLIEIKDSEADLLKKKAELDLLEKDLQLQEEVLRNLPRLEMQRKRMEIEDIKKNIYKLQSVIAKLEIQSDKLKNSQEELRTKMPFLIHPTQFLGRDKDRNLYFYFSEDPIGIYIQEHTENKNIPPCWMVYNTRDSIRLLLESLNKKGKREYSLMTNIQNLMKEELIEYKHLPKMNNINNNKPGSNNAASSTTPNEIVNELDEETKEHQEILNEICEYESIYQSQEEYIKNKKTFNKKAQLLDYFRDKIHSIDVSKRGTWIFLMEIILELEEEFSTYLKSRKWRWLARKERENLRKEALENINESKISELLILLNSRFIHIECFLKAEDEDNEDQQSDADEQETFTLKKRKNKLWKKDKDASDGEQEDENIDDFEENEGNKYYIKKKILKTWGFYNERFKQAWETFVSNKSEIGALYIGTMIFVEIICKYISRKVLKSKEEVNDKFVREENPYSKMIDSQEMPSGDYIFRKRKAGRVVGQSAVEKYNLRVRQRVKKEKACESSYYDDTYQDIDDYSPDRLKKIRNTRALTKRLNKGHN